MLNIGIDADIMNPKGHELCIDASESSPFGITQSKSKIRACD